MMQASQWMKFFEWLISPKQLKSLFFSIAVMLERSEILLILTILGQHFVKEFQFSQPVVIISRLSRWMVADFLAH